MDVLNPKSKTWERLVRRRDELRARLLRHLLLDNDMAELERITATLNAAEDAAFPELRAAVSLSRVASDLTSPCRADPRRSHGLRLASS